MVGRGGASAPWPPAAASGPSGSTGAWSASVGLVSAMVVSGGNAMVGSAVAVPSAAAGAAEPPPPPAATALPAPVST
ncbi:MAG: hypothetical protein ABS47_06920 [Devosia sp. SCN 66-27]|nr:MAG: hypothetical protein ABS47_06920 [Devosia sp. SCN 66-27]